MLGLKPSAMSKAQRLVKQFEQLTEDLRAADAEFVVEISKLQDEIDEKIFKQSQLEMTQAKTLKLAEALRGALQ